MGKNTLQKRTTMKKTMTIIAAFVLLAAFAPKAHATAYWGTVTAQTGQTLYWSLYGDNVAIVCPGIGPYSPWSLSGTDFQKPTGALVIPDSVTHNGTAYPVKYIYQYAFSGCDSLTSVVIPDAVNWIMDSAFCGCTRMTSVHLPDSLTIMDKHAFEDCSSLTSVTLPDRLTYVSKRAFYRCGSVDTIAFGSNVKYIYDSAFCQCTSLTSVTIPETIIQLGKGAFRECHGLTSIVFNAENCISAGSITDYKAFYNCYNVTSFTCGNRVKRIPDYLCSRMPILSSVTLGDSVSHIGREAFIGTGIANVTIPASVTYIGQSAFCTLFSLDTVFMKPATPPTLGNYLAFHGGINNPWVMMLEGCSYDNYYTEEDSNLWIQFHNNLRDPLYDIAISVAAADPAQGSASVITGRSDREVRCDSTAVVEATANNGYHFSHWSNGSTANPDTLQLTGDTALTAHFAADSTPEVGITAVVGDSLTVYPNPTRGKVTVSSHEALVSATVTDMAGRVVLNNKFRNNNYELDVSQLTAGAYFLTLTTASGHEHTLRLIRESGD